MIYRKQKEEKPVLQFKLYCELQTIGNGKDVTLKYTQNDVIIDAITWLWIVMGNLYHIWSRICYSCNNILVLFFSIVRFIIQFVLTSSHMTCANSRTWSVFSAESPEITDNFLGLVQSCSIYAVVVKILCIFVFFQFLPKFYVFWFSFNFCHQVIPNYDFQMKIYGYVLKHQDVPMSCSIDENISKLTYWFDKII